MAIGTPVLIEASVPGTSDNEIALTVPAGGVPAGATIFFGSGLPENTTDHALVDTAGNSYTQEATDPNHAAIDMEGFWYRCDDCLALVEGNTITWSWLGGGTVTRNGIAFYITGLDPSAPVDVQGVLEEFNNTATPVSRSIDTAADTIKLGFYVRNGASPVVDTEDTDFTNIGGDQHGAAFRHISAAYRIGGAEAITYGPTFPTTEEGFILIGSYKAAASGFVRSGSSIQHSGGGNIPPQFSLIR